MQYSTFHTLHIGAAHVKKGLPCQDMCLSENDGCHSIAVVSDGHGNRRHFRSERGSQKACEIALERIREFLNRTDDLTHEERKAQIQDLKLQICRDWRVAILEDAAANPWTQEEIEEQQRLLTDEQFIRFKSGETAALAYGCTLCAVFTADWGWGALQVGDGCLAVIEADGTYRWPMPESIFNSGHRTASLCANNPMTDFRHVIEYGHPVGLMVYSDGIEKSFPDQGKEIVALLHWVWKNQRFGGEDRLDTLTELLNQITQRSSLGDDVSIAGMIDPNAEDAAPKFGPNMQMKELQALESQREELLTTIDYNRRRLNDILRNEPGSDAEQQIRQILSRRKASLEALTNIINTKRAEIGLEMITMPEVEPETPKEEPETPEEPENMNLPEDSEEQRDPQNDHYFWGSKDDAESGDEAPDPSPDDSEPRRNAEGHSPTEYRWIPADRDPRRRTSVHPPQPTQERIPFQARKVPSDPFADLSRYMDEKMDEMLDGMNHLLNMFRKRR